MTDRYNAVVVVLAHDIRDDDAEGILNAIRHIKGVVSVTGNVLDIADHVAYPRARSELQSKLWKALEEPNR